VGDPELTVDEPVPGLSIRQPRRGHRWGVEVYLLAWAALLDPGPEAVDLGTGSGVVAALLAHHGRRVVAVERDASWLGLASRNLAPFGERVRLVAADVRSWEGPRVDVVVCNPPWFDPARGPVSPDPWRAASRSTVHGGPEDFARAGLRLADRVWVVGPRPVPVEGAHVARWGRHGRLVLSELRPGAGPSVEMPVVLEQVMSRVRGRAGVEGPPPG